MYIQFRIFVNTTINNPIKNIKVGNYNLFYLLYYLVFYSLSNLLQIVTKLA